MSAKSPFQSLIDLVDPLVDVASEVLADAVEKTSKQDPMVRLVTGFIAGTEGKESGGFTAIFDHFIGDTARPTETQAKTSPDTASTWSAATDDPTVHHPAETAARAPHSPGVHIGPDATGAMKVTSLPAKCANLECPNQSHQGDFVMVEIEEKVVSGGVRGIRLLMCAPCASGMTGSGKAQASR